MLLLYKLDLWSWPYNVCTIYFSEWLNMRAGLPRSGENIWKMKFFPGQGKVREFCGWSGKFRKNLESQGKVREFENKGQWQADLRKFILYKRGKYVLSHEIV